MTPRRRAAIACVLVGLVGLVGSVGPVAAAGPAAASPAAVGRSGATVEFFDDFASGFATSGPAAKWVVPRTDTVIGVAPGDLHVAADGANPSTGEPAFTTTVPQDGTQNGIADHGKWVALAAPPGTAGSGTFAGFPTAAGQRLTCRTTLSVRTFGTDQQPFGAAVADPQADPRLADVALIVNDLADNVVFDFTVTNREIWARYESVQLVSGGSNPASFAYAVPVARRTPGEFDRLAISYDRSANVVTYAVNGRRVLAVPRPGTYSLPRAFLTVDHGGVPRVVSPPVLACGVGMFTLLDDRLIGTPDVGLVRLAGAPGFYLDPLLGAPHPEHFVDERSLPGSRLWGQGAQFDMRSFAVVSRPVGR